MQGKAFGWCSHGVVIVAVWEKKGATSSKVKGVSAESIRGGDTRMGGGMLGKDQYPHIKKPKRVLSRSRLCRGEKKLWNANEGSEETS